tara:strand:- start:5507 stop:5698 length:192 start_codon:yes stop_codon:yes gene_type:complete
MEVITVTFDDDGNAEIEVDGVSGGRCQELTKPVEQALGLVGATVVEKPDLHMRMEANVGTRLR